MNDSWPESCGSSGSAQVEETWKAYRLKWEHSEMLREIRDCGLGEVRGHWEFPSLQYCILWGKVIQIVKTIYNSCNGKMEKGPWKSEERVSWYWSTALWAFQTELIITTCLGQKQIQWWRGPIHIGNLTSESSLIIIKYLIGSLQGLHSELSSYDRNIPALALVHHCTCIHSAALVCCFTASIHQ